jgi:transposase InsO family protein
VALVEKPGPAKVEPLNVGALTLDILRLRYGRKRTGGFGELYERYRNQISRRDLQCLVEAIRREMRRDELALMRRIEWLVPGQVWSVDDAELDVLLQGKGKLHLVRDLGSRYVLRGLGDEVMQRGERVADNLADLVRIHGAPLFLKRDNGSNLNHRAVNEVLGELGIIPLNSPPYYPPYNGGIERAQDEMKRHLVMRLGAEPVGARVFRLECEVTGHELNHRRRAVLGGRTACQALTDARGTMRVFGRRERREVYEEIQGLAVDIMEVLDEHTVAAAETAFRYAAETWMQLNQFIRVIQNGKVLPCFYQI